MIGRFLYRAFYWQYDRGSWQWDISCLVFIVIISTTPAGFLTEFTRHPLSSGEIHRILVDFLGLSAS